MKIKDHVGQVAAPSSVQLGRLESHNAQFRYEYKLPYQKGSLMKREMLEIVYLAIVVAMPELMELFDILPLDAHMLELIQFIKCVRVFDQIIIAVKNAGSRSQSEKQSD